MGDGPAGAGADLLALTETLVGVPSVSRHEAALADLVADRLAGCPWLAVDRVGDNVVARTRLGRGQRVIVAGHLDTVLPNGNDVPRIDGDVLWGLGAADMKGGLAVMLDLATTVTEPSVDVTWCFYACEEVGRHESGLGQLWDVRPDLLVADAAILGEPTDGLVEAGCQGTMRVVIHLGGVRAHTARPFTGRNAIHRLVPVLARITQWEGRTVVLDGCEYVEQLQAVAVDGGVAGNVVPDHAAVTVNYRFAPDRDVAAARRFIDALLDGLLDTGLGDRWEVVDEAAGAPPGLTHPLLAALVARSGRPPKAKVGWTDVASFWAHGVPAANFGSGDPLLAHHPDERVSRDSLDRTRAALRAVLTQSA
ncbi:MAG TPA: succinyl-diaminopimelate desuccinylase [Acidimicrobiales bacterium]|nr:succinyl-diaminopimelate desuccinylase [Acidimicrobiales bacterium]